MTRLPTAVAFKRRDCAQHVEDVRPDLLARWQELSVAAGEVHGAEATAEKVEAEAGHINLITQPCVGDCRQHNGR